MVSVAGRGNSCGIVSHPWLGVTGLVIVVAVMLVCSLPYIGSVTMAQETSGGPGTAMPGVSLKVDSGDTAWVLTSSALVLAMTMPGLALFYGGLVRSKNMLGTIMHSVIILCLVSVIWILFGYSLAFGPDKASGFIGPLSAMAIGLAAGVACYAAIVWKGRMGYDDSLDVVGIHGVGGIVGILATGLFASKAINPAGADGLFFGSGGQFGVQALTAVCVALFSLIGTWILLKFVDGVVGLRVSPEDEATGLDLSQHNERAYS